jgi:hypothetical protein
MTPTPEPTAMLVPPTTTPEPPSCEEVEGSCLELYFDGQNCANVGPTDFKVGPFTLIFFNESEIVTNVGIFRLKNDKTYQDWINYFGEEPSPQHAPWWANEQGVFRNVTELILPGEIFIWENIIVDGIHGTVCVRAEPHGAYLGGGFTVDK